MSEIQNSETPSLDGIKNDSKATDQVDSIENSHLSNAASLPKVLDRTANESKSLAGTEIKGHLFEFKLLLLFMVRANIAGYEFEIAANNEDIGGKFDDLILRYQVQDDTPKGKHWRYRYLQAKHKVDKTKLQIKASHLLSASANDKVTDYSLIKYFKSYCKMKARGDDIQDCIICTNIDFDYTDMEGIQLKPLDISDEIFLKFPVNNESSGAKNPALYKLELSEEARKKLFESDDVRILASQMMTCATKSHSPIHEIFKTYHTALVEENVVDLSPVSTKSNTMKLHQDFVDNLESLTTGARDLRQMLGSLLGCEAELAKWKFQRPGFFGKLTTQDSVKKLPNCITDNDVRDFCDKLVLIVNSPSEEKLDAIIRNDVNKFYNKKDIDSQFLRVSNEMMDWFKSIKKSQIWLSSTDSKRILLDGITEQSREFRNQLSEEIGFSQKAIENMTKTLKQVLADSADKTVYIPTLSPRWKAAKIVSAIETWPEYKATSEHSYWITFSNSLLNTHERNLWKNRLKLTKDSCHLLLVVDDNKSLNFDIQTVKDLLPDDPAWKNKIIVIFHGEENKDELQFGDLDEKSRTFILSKTILFQGSSTTIRDLISSSETDKFISFSSLQEFVDDKKPQISIPSFSTSNFQESLYMERQVMCPLQHQWLDELAKAMDCTVDKLQEDCNVDSKGKIHWVIKDENRKSEILEKMKKILKREMPTNNSSTSVVPVNELLDASNKTVIIMDNPGTGKSTILSYFCKVIKQTKPDWWVIKLNLVNHSNVLSKITANSVSAAINFLVDLPVIGAIGPFAKSLLRRRLTTGDRIIVMFDGFDEIDNRQQSTVVQLLKKLSETVQVFVTTRPHNAVELQLELSQLAYNLVKFNKKDQIDYMISLWMHDFNLAHNKEINKLATEAIGRFATSIIDRVTDSLKDQQKDFLGIPLQCRILAECFQPKIQFTLNQSINTATNEIMQHQIDDLLKRQSFDLANLYKLLMETKLKVFLEEKIKLGTDNHIVNYSIKMTIAQIKSHLTKLAIETIIQERDHVDILWSANEFRFQSQKDWQEQKEKLDEFGISFGLLIDNNEEEGKSGQLQFLHQTYAEYLVADYIYKGFLLGEKDHNKLLENERVRELIIGEIFDKYNGVGEFLDSMLKEMADYTSEEERKNQLKKQQNTDYLSNHLQQFVSSFLEKSPFFTLATRVHTNTINFLLDCLDATFLPFQVRKIVFRDIHNDFPQDASFNQHSQVFQRLLSYYDDANDEEWRRMFSRLCLVFQSKRWYRQEVHWDKEEPQKNVQIFLGYLTKYYKRFTTRKIEEDQSSRGGITNLAGFIIHNKYRQNLLPELFEFLSLTFRQNSDFLVKLLKSALNVYYNGSKLESGKITNTLKLIQQLGLNQQEIADISELVFKFEPETFKEFFKPCRPEEETDDSIENWLTVQDAWGMNRLSRASFYEDIQSIEGFIKRFLLENAVLPKDPIARSNTYHCYMHLLLPAFLYCSNEEIPYKILGFLKRVSPSDQLRTVVINQMLYTVLRHAIRFNKTEMCQLIFKCVKEIFGQDVIIHLLKLEIDHPKLSFVRITIFEMVSEMGCFKIIPEFIENYEKLNDLIFRDMDIKSILRLVEYVEPETLKRIVTAKSLVYWVLPYLRRNYDIEHVYDLLSSKLLLDALDQKQHSQLVDILIRVVPDCWTLFICKSGQKFSSDFNAMDFVKRVATIFCKNDLKKLLYHNDGNGVVFFQVMMLLDKGKVDEMLACLPPRMEVEFKTKLAKQAPKSIQDVFFERQQLQECFGRHSWLRCLTFYLDYGNEEQIANFIHAITNVRGMSNKEEYSIWNHILSDNPHLREIAIFSQRLSEKLGENAFEQLILKDNGAGIVIMRPAFIYYLSEIEVYYAHLHKENFCIMELEDCYTHITKRKRHEILQQVLATPGVTDKMLSTNSAGKLYNNGMLGPTLPICSPEYWTGYYLDITSKGIATNILTGFSLAFNFVKKLNDAQLMQYIELLVSVKKLDGTRYSIWFDYIAKACETNGKLSATTDEMVRQFLKLIVDKMGEKTLEKLIHHNCNQQILFHAASTGNIQIFEALLSQCNERQQNKIRQNFLCRLKVIENVWKRNGPDNLIRIYLQNQTSTTVATSFSTLILYFHDQFNQDQLCKLVELILSVEKFNLPHGYSVWGCFIAKVIKEKMAASKLTAGILTPIAIDYEPIRPTLVDAFNKFLKGISSRLGDKAIK